MRVSKFVREISLTLFIQRIVMYLLDIVNILTIQRNSLRRSNKDEVSFASPPGRIESCECTKRWLTKVANSIISPHLYLLSITVLSMPTTLRAKEQGS